MKRIYLSPPHVGKEERDLLLDAFDSNWIAPLGPHVDAFEKEMCKKLGCKHAVALSSGTAALHLALLCLDVKQNDVILLSSLTFCATANAAVYMGARPIFIDSSRDTWNMDPTLLVEEIRRLKKSGIRPAAVIAVDIYGQCADYDLIEACCNEHEIPLIEDAAEALGSSYKDRFAGTFGTAAVLSFNGNKIITTSGGGMLLSNNRALVDRARFLSTQARDPFPHYEHSSIGYNYRLSNLLAAVGRGQLSMLDQKVDKKREIFNRYRKGLSGFPGIAFMPEAAYGMSNRWLTCILIDSSAFGTDRETVRLLLEKKNIEARAVWKPMNMQPVFSDARFVGTGICNQLFQNGLCLPSGTSLTESNLDFIIEEITNIHNEHTKR